MITTGLIIIAVIAGGIFGRRVILKDRGGIHTIHEENIFRGSTNPGTEVVKFTFPVNEFNTSLSYYKEINNN
jgi:hypothetical protein